MKCPDCGEAGISRPWTGTVKVMGKEMIGYGEQYPCGFVVFDWTEVKRQDRIATGEQADPGLFPVRA